MALPPPPPPQSKQAKIGLGRMDRRLLGHLAGRTGDYRGTGQVRKKTTGALGSWDSRQIGHWRGRKVND